MNWKLHILLIGGICFVFTQEPDEFQYHQSSLQANYFFYSVTLNGIHIDNEDWVGAFKDGKCVGSVQWDTSQCGNGVCSIAIMGDDGFEYTAGYMVAGDIPTFKIYDASDNTYHDAEADQDKTWSNNFFPIIDTLISCTHYDCEGRCGGSAEYDDCGTCSMGFTGHVPNSEMDCEGICGGNAEDDDCGICNGPGQNIQCWDLTLLCNINECPYNPDNCPNGTTYLEYYPGNENSENEKKCVPENFISVNSSNQQAFYYFHSVAINGIPIDNEDWVGAFNGDVCVGARQWGICNGNTCDVPIMGEDGNELTEGYMQYGDMPTFKIYDVSDETYFTAIPSSEIAWQSMNSITIDSLTFCEYELDCNDICGGSAELDECGICSGDNNSCSDCAGIPNGDTIIDECGVCGGAGPMPNYNCEGIMSSIISNIPNEFTLYNLYPNPFNPILNISYQLPTSHYTLIVIHDINGKKIKTINNGFQPSGNYMAIWDASNVTSGVYLISLKDQNFINLSKIQKAILIK